MNIKGNIKYVISGSALFLVIYIFVAAIPMGPDIYFEPVWTRDVTSPAGAGSANVPPANILPAETAPAAKTPVPASPGARETGTGLTGNPLFKSEPGIEAFVLGNRFGYFTPDGRILSSTITSNRITTSTEGWAVYPENARGTVIYFPDGRPRMTIKESGFPYLDDDRTYLFLPGGDGVSQYGNDGKRLWTREHPAPVTAFNSSPAGTIIGYADGQLVCLGPDGTERFTFAPGGSDYQVILGAALSEDGRFAACVAGIDKQRFLLIQMTGNQYKVIFHTYLEGNLRRQAFVDFEQNGSYAFFESETGLGIIDCRKFTASRIPVKGTIVGAGECPGKTLFVTLIKNGSRYTLQAVERPDHLVASTDFTAENAFLVQREGIVYLGTDNRISRINIRGIR